MPVNIDIGSPSFSIRRRDRYDTQRPSSIQKRNTLNLPSQSRQRLADIIEEEDGTEYFSMVHNNALDFRSLPPLKIEPSESLRADLVAYLLYNSPYLWWVLPYTNNFSFPMKDMPAGIVINTPDATEVARQVTRGGNSLSVRTSPLPIAGSSRGV